MPPAKSPSGVSVFQEGRVSGLTDGEQETPSTEQIGVALFKRSLETLPPGAKGAGVEKN